MRTINIKAYILTYTWQISIVQWSVKCLWTSTLQHFQEQHWKQNISSEAEPQTELPEIIPIIALDGVPSSLGEYVETPWITVLWTTLSNIINLLQPKEEGILQAQATLGSIWATISPWQHWKQQSQQLGYFYVTRNDTVISCLIPGLSPDLL